MWGYFATNQPSHTSSSSTQSFFFSLSFRLERRSALYSVSFPQNEADHNIWYSIFGGFGRGGGGGVGREWTCKEITLREVEQQQCTDYRQDLCEGHMISTLIPLSDWLWWRGGGGLDRREVVSDSLGRSQIGTESDDSSSHFNEKSSCSQMTWPPANSILANHFGMSFFFFFLKGKEQICQLDWMNAAMCDSAQPPSLSLRGFGTTAVFVLRVTLTVVKGQPQWQDCHYQKSYIISCVSKHPTKLV